MRILHVLRSIQTRHTTASSSIQTRAALLTALLALYWHRTRRAKKASAVLSAVGASEALLPAEALNTAPVVEDYQLADDGPGGRGFPDRKASLERLSSFDEVD